MPLVNFKCVGTRLDLHGLVAPRPRDGHLHRLLEELESVDLLDRILGALQVVKDHEGLALGLEILLGYNVDDIAKLGEDDPQLVDDGFDLDPFFEILHVDTVSLSAKKSHGASVCNDTHVDIGGSAAILCLMTFFRCQKSKSRLILDWRDGIAKKKTRLGKLDSDDSPDGDTFTYDTKGLL